MTGPGTDPNTNGAITSLLRRAIFSTTVMMTLVRLNSYYQIQWMQRMHCLSIDAVVLEDQVIR
jgi:hypothetical protein